MACLDCCFIVITITVRNKFQPSDLYGGHRAGAPCPFCPSRGRVSLSLCVINFEIWVSN